jgi:glycosyltransferase involved in cell wall biosynthesis
MRILMLLENEFRRDSRVEKEIQTLFYAGHEIIVAAINQSGLPYQERRENCTVFRKIISKFILKSSVGALKFPCYFNFWRRYVNELFKKYKFDAIHIHDLPLAIVGIEIKQRYKAKLVLDFHENWPALLSVSSHTNTFFGKILSSENEWRTYEKRCAGKADRIITVVSEMKNRISKLGVPAEKIYILENTPQIATENEIKHERDEKFFTLVYIGGISFHRGLQYVINGINLITNEVPVRLWIAGDGKYTNNIKEQVTVLGLHDIVEFFGLLPKDKTEDLMKKADAGLIPHIRSEQSDNSSPNKLYEYMAAGLPVLASDSASVKRIINETDTGVTYVFDSPDDFAIALKRLYIDPEKRAVYASNGKKAVAERYNWDKSSGSLVNLYSCLE